MTKELLRYVSIVAFALAETVYGVAWAGDIQGKLVIVGGGLRANNVDVYGRFIELAGGKEAARIGIVPAASSKPVKNGDKLKSTLVEFGVPAEQIEVIPVAIENDKTTEDVDESTWIENAKDSKLAEKVKGLTGVWFIGGDQTRITKALINEAQPFRCAIYVIA